MTSQHTTVKHNFALKVDPQRLRSIASIVVSGIGAAIAALACHYAGLPLWAMYIGWLLFHTRQRTFSHACVTVITAVLGLALGIVTSLGVEWMIPRVHLSALPIGVFIATVIILSLSKVKPFDNLMPWFLGVIAILASHMPLSFRTLCVLTAAIALGSLTGWITYLIQPRAKDHQ